MTEIIESNGNKNNNNNNININKLQQTISHVFCRTFCSLHMEIYIIHIVILEQNI